MALVLNSAGIHVLIVDITVFGRVFTVYISPPIVQLPDGFVAS